MCAKFKNDSVLTFAILYTSLEIKNITHTILLTPDGFPFPSPFPSKSFYGAT